MIWRILPHTTVCIASDRIILLDIRRDRYLLVPSSIAGSMRAWLEGDPIPAPAAVTRLLTDNHVMRPGDPAPTNRDRDTVRIPTALLSPIWDTGSAPPDHRAVIGAQIITKIHLKTRSLASVLSDHMHPSTARPPPAAELLHRRAATFARSRILSPFARNCLLDTLSLDRWLAEDARDCRIVFGVTGHPFTAHCWLQSPFTVLNDSYDHASRHTPILAL